MAYLLYFEGKNMTEEQVNQEEQKPTEESAEKALADTPAQQPKKKKHSSKKIAWILICIAAVLAVGGYVMEENELIDIIPDKAIAVTLEYPEEGTLNDSLIAAYQSTDTKDKGSSYAIDKIADPSTGEEVSEYAIGTVYQAALSRTSSIGYQ